MKIAYILGKFSLGSRPLSLSTAFTDDRGLTGTELATLRCSEELVKLGHSVFLFIDTLDNLNEWKNIKVYNYEDRIKIVDDTFDSIISINEPNVFFGMARKPKRICWQYLNDFSFVQPNFDQEVDQYIGVCQQHSDHCAKNSNTVGKWLTVPLGCDDIYKDERVPGRVIWCSSNDRGLHWLLSKWSKIKQEVPEASLKIFYHMSYGEIENVEDGTNNHHHVIEMAQRIRYIKNAIKELKHLGVEHVGSVSRERMAKEFSEASVFAFPCDTVAFSEGFSVSTLEAHASHTVPIITDVDCLGGIYNNSGCIMIKSPVSERLDDFADSVIKALKDKKFANKIIKNTLAFSRKMTWKSTVQQLEKICRMKKI